MTTFDGADPSLHPHYRGFSTTTISSAPVQPFGCDRFSRSVLKPVTKSCRLYTGCRLPRNQVPYKLIPELLGVSGFDNKLGISIRHRRFAFAHLLVTHLTLIQCLFPARSPPRLLNEAAVGGLVPLPEQRHRGAIPHLQYSITHLADECS